MATCYDCGDRIPAGSGVRYSVQTGFSVGAKSSRLYYRQVFLCPTCASVRRRKDEQALVRFGVFAVAIVGFFITLGMINPSEPSKQSTNQTLEPQPNVSDRASLQQPEESPTVEPTLRTPQDVSSATSSPEAIPSPIPTAIKDGFNAEIFAPPSNCRIGAGRGYQVKQVLQKGDVLVDRDTPQTDSKGELWYREQYLGCWLHQSQIRFK